MTTTNATPREADVRTPILCEKTGKLLARRDVQGIYLWCKACKAEHWFPDESNAQTSNTVASEEEAKEP